MIETTHIRLEQAAASLNTSVDALMSAALDGRVRLWALLFEWREYWEWNYSSDDEMDHDLTDVGHQFFGFIPLYRWHVAALLKHGKVETNVLSDVDRIQKHTPSDQRETIIVTRDEPLYMLTQDVQRIKLEGELPAANQEPVPPPGERDYVSEQLSALLHASKKWWAHANRYDPDTHPNNADVASWLETKHGFSATLAEKAASIVRPEWAHRGRKPDKW